MSVRGFCSFFVQAKERTSSLYQDKEKKGTKEYSLLVLRMKEHYRQRRHTTQYFLNILYWFEERGTLPNNEGLPASRLFP